MSPSAVTSMSSNQTYRLNRSPVRNAPLTAVSIPRKSASNPALRRRARTSARAKIATARATTPAATHSTELRTSATNVTPNGLPHPPNAATRISPPPVWTSSTTADASIAATAISITHRWSVGHRRSSTVSAAPASGTMTGQTARPSISASSIIVHRRPERIAELPRRMQLVASQRVIAPPRAQHQRREHDGEREADDDRRQDERLRHRIGRFAQPVGALADQRWLRRPDPPGLEQDEVHRRRQQRQPEHHAHEMPG